MFKGKYRRLYSATLLRYRCEGVQIYTQNKYVNKYRDNGTHIRAHMRARERAHTHTHTHIYIYIYIQRERLLRFILITFITTHNVQQCSFFWWGLVG